ncbi:MAG: ATP-binding cassette domain-containing protein [Saprospiraceae bacterium]|nr:ATP-binding cassette domain-containing protein [Candidatus Opimibacter iunctus]
MIQIDSLSKAYGSHIVLRDIRLQFEKGMVYGIVGENGSGKTTLFKCLAGLETCHGHIKSEFNPIKNHIGFLPTDPYFFSKITGKEYLQLLCNARKTSGGHMDEKNVFDLPLDQYASTYSTGMKKKLALTAILLQQNDIYILDEPYNGVDIHSNMIITEIIHSLRALNKVVILSSHIFSTLRDTCDQIHHLRDGQISTSVTRENFDSLEAEMKAYTIGNRIAKLDLK